MKCDICGQIGGETAHLRFTCPEKGGASVIFFFSHKISARSVQRDRSTDSREPHPRSLMDQNTMMGPQQHERMLQRGGGGGGNNFYGQQQRQGGGFAYRGGDQNQRGGGGGHRGGNFGGRGTRGGSYGVSLLIFMHL